MEKFETITHQYKYDKLDNNKIGLDGYIALTEADWKKLQLMPIQNYDSKTKKGFY